MSINEFLLQSVLQETRKRQSSGMEKVQWRGRTVAIKSDKIRAALINADEIRSDLSSTSKDHDEKLSTYTNLFMAYGDALEVIRSEQKQLAAKSANQKTAKSEAEDSNLSYLIKYISYLKLTKTIERNRLLVDKLQEQYHNPEAGTKKTKPDELVRIYDNLIQNYKELEETTDAEEVENKKSAVAKGLSCRAFRCYYLALSYINTYEWNKGLALLERCAMHVEVAKSHHLDCLNHDKTELSALEKLGTRIQGDRSIVKAKAYLDTVQLGDQQPSGSLSENLDVFSTAFVDNQQIANFPPECQPTICKPVLFDLAHLELEFPSLEPVVEKKSFWKFWG